MKGVSYDIRVALDDLESTASVTDLGLFVEEVLFALRDIAPESGADFVQAVTEIAGKYHLPILDAEEDFDLVNPFV